MAKIIAKGKEVEIKNGSPIKEVCEGLGVPFSCSEGICGTCTIDILEGEKNLNPLNSKEKVLGMDSKTRLACQCKIKKGDVKIDF